MVTDLDLVWNDLFKAGFKYPANFPITIMYHTVMDIDVPMSAEEAKGKKYKDVIMGFEQAGFSNISTKVKYDIVTGWFVEVGEVEAVVVDGDEEFDEGYSYHPNSEIVITYHDLKKINLI